MGVVQAYKLAKKYVDCQLVLAGGGANDDPEGAAVLQEPETLPATIPTSSSSIFLRGAPCRSSHSACIRDHRSEVFKGRFRTHRHRGALEGQTHDCRRRRRIPNQIIHNLTGVLVHSVEGCAFQIRYLLTHPEFARTIGANGREHVKENFLMSSNVKRWLLLFRILEQAKARLPKAA